MGKYIFPTLLVFASALLGASGNAFAQDQPKCDTRANILAYAEERLKETPVVIGVSSAGTLIEVLASEGGTTWSIISSAPNGGLTCVLTVGESLHVFPLELFGPRL